LRVAADDADRTALWAGRLAAFHAFKATGKEFYVCDATVPRQRLPEMIVRARDIAASRALDVATVGHAGDGNIHPVILHAREELETVYEAAGEVAEAALGLGGTLTGEHGVGTAKVAHMARCFSPVELAAFRAIKRAFDPHEVLNPAVMLKPAAAGEPELELFGRAVSAALAGRQPAVPPPVAEGPGDEEISVDVENMTLTAGASAACLDAAAAVERSGLSCPAMQVDGLVGPVIEQAGSSQPARGALLGVEAVLPDGYDARFGSSAMKDVAGLDVKRLLAGGRRAFGEVSRVTLKAAPRR
jgi:glycolate oxidase